MSTMIASKLVRAGAGIGLTLAVLGGSRQAHALDCTTLPSPIYAAGDSEWLPILREVATALSVLSSPVTVVYQSTGGLCSGVNAIVSATPITGSASYWDSTGTQQTCTFAVAQPVDLGISDTTPTSCPGVATLPEGVGDFLGPIQAYDFIVPYTSSQTSISAEAAYFIFGFGAGQSNPAYSVSPWTVPANIITRNNQSSTTAVTARTLNLPLADVANTTVFTDGKSSAETLTDVGASAAPESTLGIVAASVAETASPDSIHVLAYQHYGQSCGWLPSSSATTFDKINVRVGLYDLWSNVHFIANVDASNVPTNANAAQVIGWFEDTIAPPTGVDVDALTVKAGGVLDCAMEVQRSTDGGPLLPYAPPAPCGCFFEANATGATTCQTCTTSSTCPAASPQCRKGYCEVN